MNKRTLAMTAALFLTVSAGSALAETLHGTIADAMCSRKHVNATPADVACAQKCFNGGSPAVFIVGDKVYKIDNQNAIKESIVGHKVEITGTVKGDTIHVDHVQM
jgi:hypothetical protein